MIEIVLFFIGASLLLYVLLGGADYGAGILELLPTGSLRKEQKEVINEAMGPVWEANHMWLILVVVILFMGFPLIFTTLMTYLHIPMVALLLGIVVRGCAFTFRHYDAIQAKTSQKVYTVLFGVSSLWTALWLGIITASLTRGHIDTQAQDFYSAYIAPWWGLHPLMMGLFISSIFGFLAAVYLIGETEDQELKKLFVRRGYTFNLLTILTGGLVFISSWLEGGTLLKDFAYNPMSVTCMTLATFMFLVLWFFIRKRQVIQVRVTAAGQVTLILLGWYFLYAPHALITKQGPIDFYDAAAPQATLIQLVLALCIGSLFIFPSLIFLIKVFKTKTKSP